MSLVSSLGARPRLARSQALGELHAQGRERVLPRVLAGVADESLVAHVAANASSGKPRKIDVSAIWLRWAAIAARLMPATSEPSIRVVMRLSGTSSPATVASSGRSGTPRPTSRAARRQSEEVVAVHRCLVDDGQPRHPGCPYADSPRDDVGVVTCGRQPPRRG